METLLHWLVGTALANEVSSTNQALGNNTISTSQIASASDLANRVLSILTFLAFPLTLAGIIYTAYLLLTSQGNPDAWTKAKKNISYILIGFVLIYGAVIILYALRSILNA